MFLKKNRRELYWGVVFLLSCHGLFAQTAPGDGRAGYALPLETTRTVDFTTDEGTWLSLDVSPDGSQIVFDLMGDLYLLPMEGGDATRFTKGPAWDNQPRFSPDGREIVFVSDRDGTDNLWLISADGSDLRSITQETKFVFGAPAFSPDGNYIAARRGETTLDFKELWLFHKHGGKGVQLTRPEGPTRSVAGPVFSPDGRYLYFSSSPNRHIYNLDLGHWQLRRLDRETGALETLTAAYGGGLRPSLSPDGRSLVYGSRHDARTGLRLRDLESGDERWLVYPIDRDEQEGHVSTDLLPGYAFTPDGNAVVLSFGGKIHTIDVRSSEVTPIRFTAHVQQELAPLVHFSRRLDEGPVQARQLRWMSASPDGTRLVFSALGKIWTADLPDGQPRRLTDSADREYAPRFSPDGRFVAYVSWTDQEGGHLWKVPAEGGTPKRLSQVPGYYHHPSWSSDGERLVYVMGSARAWLAQDFSDVQQIRWVSSEGGKSFLVTDSPIPAPSRRLPAQQPTFRLDGERIFYLDHETLTERRDLRDAVIIRSVRLDGTDGRAHLRLPGASQAIASPDGASAAFLLRGDGYLVAMPRTSEPLTIDLDAPAVPVRRITREGAADLNWDADGETLSWAVTNHFYRIDRDDVLEAEGSELKPSEVSITLSAPRHTASGRVALRGARIVTMRGDEILPQGDVVVENHRIMAVGRSGDIPIPDDAQVFDVAGKTIVPGLIDVHDHLRPVRDIIPERAWSLAAHLAYGVTTGFDPSADNQAIFTYAEMVEAGELTGQRIFSTGSAMNVSAARIDSLEDARNIVRQYKKLGAIAIKEYLQPRRIQRQWLMMAAREEGLNATADGGNHLAFDMTHVLDGFTGFEHSIPAVPVYRDVIELMARGKTYYCPTLVVDLVGPQGEYYFRQKTDLHADAKLRRFVPHEEIDRKTRRRLLALEEDYRFVLASEAAAATIRQGGSAVVGGHGEEQGLATHWELWMFEMGGLTPLEALRAATLAGAEAIGLQADLGSIEPGKIADLVVLNKNPLENIRHSTDILYVMRNGELFEGETLDQLWPEKVPFEPFYWQREEEMLIGR